MKTPFWVTLMTLTVAIYGAILSTYNVYMARKDKRRALKVQASFGFLTAGPSLSPQMLIIEVANSGARDVQINVPALELPTGHTMVFMSPQSDVSFPHSLREGTSCRIWSPLEWVAAELRGAGFSGEVPLIPFCQDAVGTKHRGKSCSVDANFGIRPVSRAS